MEFNDYQKKNKITDISLEKFNENFPNMPEGVKLILGLSYYGLGLGEAGEIQGKIKKIIRDSGGNLTKEYKENIKKELGDLLWYVSSLSTCLGFELNDIAKENIEKLQSRKKRGTLRGEGDNR